MSPAATLRTTCVQRTCDLLMRGVWDACEENPFSYMPISVVQDLLSYMWTAKSSLNRAARFAHSRLLLTSGSLERVVLPRVRYVREYVTPLQMLSRGCQNLRTLSVLFEGCGEVDRDSDAEQALQELLQNCPKLESLHSRIYIDLNDLRNCANLRILGLHFFYEKSVSFTRSVTSDVLKQLLSVEKFHLGMRFRKGEESYVSRAFLDNCPRLTSLGGLESSAALKELHDRDLGTLRTPRQFNLRKCLWRSGTKSDYRERIRVAALSCPMVEVLLIRGFYADVILHFKALRCLTSLVIDFRQCVDDYRKEFCSLLEEVGHQLRHIYVNVRGLQPLSLNVICGNCPNLITLKLDGPLIADEGVRPFVHLPNLERLSVRHSDQKCLFFLLSNCLHLKVLCMGDCFQLDDGAMQAIIQKNPFAELEVACLYGCYLSEWGWRRFLQSAPKLTKYYFFSPHLLSSDEAKRCVKDLNPSARSFSGYYDFEGEQFPLDRYSSSCWM